jgi:hypothetical protein
MATWRPTMFGGSSLLRLRGGGGDGGVYPLTHSELKWMTPSEMGTSGGGCHSNATKDKVSEGSARLDRARVCAASSKALKAPIVVCDLGYLLNKEDVIEHLLAKTLPPHLTHIRSLKNLHDATLHANPAYVPTSGHVQGAEDDDPPFYCPISMLPMNGRYPFVYIQPTGHVVSQRAFKQVGSRLCPITERSIGPDETIPVNPPDDERKALQERLAAKKALAAESKRRVKEGAEPSSSAAAAASSAGAARDASAATADPSGASVAVAEPAVARPQKGVDKSVSAVTTAATTAAAGTAAGRAVGGALGGETKRLGEGKRRAEDGGGGSSHSAASAGGGGGKRPIQRPIREWDRVVQAKANGSEVYKSLFLTPEERARQEREETAAFCARGIVPSVNRSKFGLG